MTLSAWDLQGMRDTQDAHLPDKMDVYKITYTSDGFGGVNQNATLDLVADDVPCVVTPAQVQMLSGQADRQLEVEKWTVRAPVDYDIRDEYILVVTSMGGQQLQVESAKRPKSYETLGTYMCEYIRANTWDVP